MKRKRTKIQMTMDNWKPDSPPPTEEPKKKQTVGEFIKTRAAKAESDSKIRTYINRTLQHFPGSKLVKYKVGPFGTLDYGRAVILISYKRVYPDYPEGDKLRKKLEKPHMLVIRVDFGIIARHTGNMIYPFDSYLLMSAAEKKYNEYVRWFVKG